MEEKYENTLFVSVFDTVYVSDLLIVGIMVARLHTWPAVLDPGSPLVQVDEYRELFGDWSSTDEQIIKRLQYMEAFCRNIIKPELKSYVRNKSSRS